MMSILTRLAAVLALAAGLVLGAQGAANADNNALIGVQDVVLSVPVNIPITVQDTNLGVLSTISDTGSNLATNTNEQSTVVEQNDVDLDHVIGTGPCPMDDVDPTLLERAPRR